jgi:hypothetical protein
MRPGRRAAARVLSSRSQAPTAARLPAGRRGAHAQAAQLIEGRAGERDIGLLDRRLRPGTRADDRRAEFLGSGFKDAPGFVMRVERSDERCAGLQDADLLARDRRSCLAENLGVLEPDVGDDGDFAVDNVCRVEPPANADLDDRPLASRFGENDEGGGGQKIEPGRVDRRAPGLARGVVGVER